MKEKRIRSQDRLYLVFYDDPFSFLNKLHRGGSWYTDFIYCADSVIYRPNHWSNSLGFRIVSPPFIKIDKRKARK